jgi:serine/threonine-protein kinase
LLGRLVAGRYQVLERIGEGGVGRVYRAVQVDLERLAAIKILHPELSNDPERKARFHREARAASRLNHPGAVLVYDHGEWEGQLFMAMEFLKGRSLFDILRQDAPLPDRRVVELLGQVCEALGVAHDQGIVHRDLKPDNVIVLPGPQQAPEQERVKVVDFGMAILVGSEAEQRLTADGVIAGTPYYMSPEQCQSRDLDGRSDIYALGVMLYEMLCGAVPFSAPSPTEVVIQHLFQDPVPPSVVRPELKIDRALEALALRALAKDPAARPQTTASFRDELLAALETAHPERLRRRRALLETGDRQTRARAAGLPATGGGPADEPAGIRLLVVESPRSFAGSVTAALRANDFAATGPLSLEQAREQLPRLQPRALVVDLGPEPERTLARLTEHLQGGRLQGTPVVVIGPGDTFELMSSALELGLAAYVPASQLVAKLPRALRRLARRKR